MHPATRLHSKRKSSQCGWPLRSADDCATAAQCRNSRARASGNMPARHPPLQLQDAQQLLTRPNKHQHPEPRTHTCRVADHCLPDSAVFAAAATSQQSTQASAHPQICRSHAPASNPPKQVRAPKKNQPYHTPNSPAGWLITAQNTVVAAGAHQQATHPQKASAPPPSTPTHTQLTCRVADHCAEHPTVFAAAAHQQATTHPTQASARPNSNPKKPLTHLQGG
jgi:hypothetical protein